MNSFNGITDFISKSPKAELHLHIEGSLEPELMFKLSKRNKVEIPFKNVDEIRSAYNFTNLDSFLKIYYEGSNVLISVPRVVCNVLTMLQHSQHNYMLCS